MGIRMRETYQHDGITWVDLESPTREEVAQVADEFGIAIDVAEELLLPSSKPRVDVFPEYVYAVMHFPALRHTHHSREQEMDFIIGKEFLVTTHYDTIDPLHKFSKVFEVNQLLERSMVGEHAGFLFFQLLKRLYKAVLHEVEYVRRDLISIEEHIFSGHEVRMVSAISHSARDLLNLRQTIEPHREILRTLEQEGPRFFGEEFAPTLRALSDEYYRVHNRIMRETDSLHELRETNNSLLSTKQNETLRIFTTLAFFTFPLALIVAWTDSHLSHNPFAEAPQGFWILTGMVVVTGLSMFLYFRHKKWL